MAKYTITYACGCTEEMQLFDYDIEGKIEYLKTIKCPHCRAAEAKKEAEESGLIALKGSDKQISWANDIRRKTINIIKNERIIERIIPEAKDKFNKRLDSLFSEDSASFWIENRKNLTFESVTLIKFLKDKYSQK